MACPSRPTRTQKKSSHQDNGYVEILEHNGATGAKKVMVVQPDIIAPYVASTPIGAGRLIKITAAGTYNLEMIGRDYDSSKSYNIGDIVAEGTDVYMAQEDKITGAFDASKWKKVALKTITGIPNAAGDVVSTGRWHNAISVAGFEVEDDTCIPYTAVRR